MSNDDVPLILEKLVRYWKNWLDARFGVQKNFLGFIIDCSLHDGQILGYFINP
jgi:hypothetical protein